MHTAPASLLSLRNAALRSILGRAPSHLANRFAFATTTADLAAAAKACAGVRGLSAETVAQLDGIWDAALALVTPAVAS